MRLNRGELMAEEPEEGGAGLVVGGFVPAGDIARLDAVHLLPAVAQARRLRPPLHHAAGRVGVDGTAVVAARRARVRHAWISRAGDRQRSYGRARPQQQQLPRGE